MGSTGFIVKFLEFMCKSGGQPADLCRSRLNYVRSSRLDPLLMSLSYGKQMAYNLPMALKTSSGHWRKKALPRRATLDNTATIPIYVDYRHITSSEMT